MDFKLYDFQQKAVDDIEAEMAFSDTRDLAIDMPTGSGKSAVIAEISKLYKHVGVLILTNITELIEQISEHLDIMNVKHSILKAGMDSKFDPDCEVQLVMSQTFYARIDKYKSIFNRSFEIIQQDEGHREFDTQRTQKILSHISPKHRILYSATPYDADGFKLDGAEIIGTKSVQHLQDDGKLAPVKYFIPKWSQKVDYSKVKMNGSEYNMTSLDKVITTGKHISKCIESMNLMDAKNKKTIVFCSSVEHCQAVTTELQINGYKAEQVHSKRSDTDNDNIIYAFKHGTKFIAGAKRIENNNTATLFKSEPTHIGSEVHCLVSVMKLTTGFSVKDIKLGVMMASTSVRSKYIQQVGRLARTHPDKTHAELLDLGLNFVKFGFHTTEFNPMIRTGNHDEDKALKLQSEADQEIVHLSDSLTDELEEFDVEQYTLRIKALAKKDEELRTKAKDITNWTMKDLAQAYDYTDDINIVISIGAEIYVRKFGDPISKAGRSYKYDPKWIAENFLEAMAKYPDQKRKWLKAYKTRCRNIIKQEKNFNALKFFSNFLVEKHEDQLAYVVNYENIAKDDSEPRGNASYADVIIDESEVPF